MGLQGLNKFKERQAAEKARREEQNTSPYFKLGPGESVRIRPLAELDEDSANYLKKNGTANFVREYQNPVKFWLSVVDTYDPEEGTSSVGFEMTRKFGWYAQNPKPDRKQHNDKTKNWNPKDRWYLPVLVDRGDDSEITVEVLQMTHGEKSWSQGFIDFYEAKGSITDRWWDFSRNNADPREKGVTVSDVKYTLTPDDKSKLDLSKYEVPDIDDAPYVNHVPYEEQREFLKIDETYSEDNEAPEKELVGATTSSAASEDW
jgi:hypothetical protein